MSLSEQITIDMKNAMKAKENATLSTLRLLRSAIKNKEIDVKHDLSDEEVQAVIKSQAKQLKDSLESFTKAGRTELADGVRVEITVLEKYMPAQLSDEELKVIVEKTIADVGATSKADMGKVMGAAMKAAHGGADGNRVKEIVQTLLPVLALMLIIPTGVFAAIPLVEAGESVQSSYSIEFGLRAARVLILWIGVASVVSMLSGGFQYMTASMRDDSHISAITKMTHGFLGTVIVAGLFSVMTVYLNYLG